MNYRYMGRTGLKVSELCLGTMTFGREIDEKAGIDILDYFVDAGGNFVDTADVYSKGAAEEVLGRWLRGKNRDSLVIGTKVRWPMDDGPNDSGLSRKHIMAGIDASLRRLGTDYIDLYQLHGWDPGTPLEETLSTMNGLVQSGKVRYIGVSNVIAWQLQKAIDISYRNGWEVFATLQPLYNLLDRDIEWELVPICLNEGVGIIPWSPLRGGWLSGKYRRGMSSPPAGSRVLAAEKEGWSESWSAYNTEHTWAVIDALLAVSQDTGKTPAQTALNWLLQRPGVTAPIVGARTVANLKDNFGAVGWSLSSEQMLRLDTASAKAPTFHHNFIEQISMSRIKTK